MSSRRRKHPNPPPAGKPFHKRLQFDIGSYFWFILKNVIGWLFIIGSFPLGVAIPGPGGIPIFLIGFGLVTFPGKRKLTSRVLRGRSLPLEAGMFTLLTALVCVLVTTGLIIYFREQYRHFLNHLRVADPIDLFVAMASVCVIAFVVTWVVTRLALRIMNFVLRRMPRIRRSMRPWLRKYGINLLPSRRRTREDPQTGEVVAPGQDEILEIHERHFERLRAAWSWAKPWLSRAFSVGMTIGIFYFMFRPLQEKWDGVKDELARMSVWRFVVASVMFAVFLFLFRVMSWRRVLKGFGFTLPVAATTRIWTTSELARYLPGSIWQFAGRVYLIKPYGVSGTVCSTTQVLETCIFLLANLLVAATCLLWFGAKNIQPPARTWFFVAMAMLPTLSLLLHPKIFYTVTNAILTRINKPPIVTRLRGRKLVQLLAIMSLGLLWQSLAVFLITQQPLQLKIDWWWVTAGAYCLAWCAGLLAFWAPGGVGVRELVFVGIMQVVLPQRVKEQFQSDPNSLLALLSVLSVLLRLWTICGELLLTAAAYLFDFAGALNLPDAPGRDRRPVSDAGRSARRAPPAHPATE